MTKRITMRDRVRAHLKVATLPRTAQHMASSLNLPLGSLSSLLKKMSSDGSVTVTANYGPRGGNGYSLTPGK